MPGATKTGLFIADLLIHIKDYFSVVGYIHWQTL